MKVCRTLKLRDDTDIVRNNIIYYYNIGIKDQFIMLHLPTPELLDIIKKVEKELPALNLRLLYWNKEGKGLNPIDGDYLKVLTDMAQSEGFNWIVGSDSDEFLILRKHNTIQELIKEYDNNEIISLLFKWVNYYLLEKSDSPFYLSMTKRSNYMPWTKSIGKFNDKMYFVQGLHHIADKIHGQISTDLKQIRIDASIAYYAHFPYRSEKQFVDKNIKQSEKFGDWRKEKVENDPYYFNKKWDNMFKNKLWSNNLDKNPDNNYNKEYLSDPVNPELMELKND